MSLFYSYIVGSLHVSGPQAHLQESSYSYSHNHWFSICPLWTRVLCVVACLGDYSLLGPKQVETQQYTNKIVTSVGFHSIRWKDARYKKLKIYTVLHCNFHRKSCFNVPYVCFVPKAVRHSTVSCDCRCSLERMTETRRNHLRSNGLYRLLK